MDMETDTETEAVGRRVWLNYQKSSGHRARHHLKRTDPQQHMPYA